MSTIGSPITIRIFRLVNRISGVTPIAIINNERNPDSNITKAKKLNRLARSDRLKSPLPNKVNDINSRTICNNVCIPKGIGNCLII